VHGPLHCTVVACGGSKLVNMNQSHTDNGSLTQRFGKHVLAGLVLLIALWIVVKLVIGIVVALFIPILAIVAIVAIVWAMRVLL
jgi:hypothetical protein